MGIGALTSCTELAHDAHAVMLDIDRLPPGASESDLTLPATTPCFAGMLLPPLKGGSRPSERGRGPASRSSVSCSDFLLAQDLCSNVESRCGFAFSHSTGNGSGAGRESSFVMMRRPQQRQEPNTIAGSGTSLQNVLNIKSAALSLRSRYQACIFSSRVLLGKKN